MTSRSTLAGLAAVLALGIGLGACAGGSAEEGSGATTTTPSGEQASTPTSPSTTATTTTPTAPGTLEVRLFQFRPTPATVAVGETVTFVNGDDTTHTATAGSPEAPTGSFDLRLAGPGARATFTPTAPGTYTYYCANHESMRGELVVTG